MEESSSGLRPRSRESYSHFRFHPYLDYRTPPPENVQYQIQQIGTTISSDLEMMILANAPHEYLIAAANPAYLQLLNHYHALENYLQTVEALYQQNPSSLRRYNHPHSTSPPGYVESLGPAQLRVAHIVTPGLAERAATSIQPPTTSVTSLIRQHSLDPDQLPVAQIAPSLAGTAFPATSLQPPTTSFTSFKGQHVEPSFPSHSDASSKSFPSPIANPAVINPRPMTNTSSPQKQEFFSASALQRETDRASIQPILDPAPYLFNNKKGTVTHSTATTDSLISHSFASALGIRPDSLNKAVYKEKVFLSLSVPKVPSRDQSGLLNKDDIYLNHAAFPFILTRDLATDVVLGRDWIDFASELGTAQKITFASHTFERREQCRVKLLPEPSLCAPTSSPSPTSPVGEPVSSSSPPPPGPPDSSSSKAKSGPGASKSKSQSNRSNGSNNTTSPSSLSKFAVEDYPNVNYWYEKAWHAARRAAADIRSTDFLEDQDGNPITFAERYAVYAEAQKCWVELGKKTGEDIPCFRNAPAEAVKEFIERMEGRFPFLKMCESHWKSKKVWMHRLPRWKANLVRKEGKEGEVSRDDGGVLVL